MKGPSGFWFLDGHDVWDNFGLIFEKGTADFLKPPPRKDTNQYDWPDQNGLDIDTSVFFFKERAVTINCAMISDTEENFWTKRTALLTLLRQPGTRRLILSAHGIRQYFVVYKDSSTPVKYGSLKGTNGETFIAYRLNITFIEPDPENPLNETMTFLAAEDGALIVT